MSYTKGEFKDGHKGWKKIKSKMFGVEGYSIIWSEDEEHITDFVYTLEDAKIIEKAPEMYELLKDLRGCRETWSDMFTADKDKVEELLNYFENESN